MIKLLRPKQWTKNLLVFAALLFTGSYGDTKLVGLAVLAFVAMCLISSGVYIFNDIRDKERDAKHPRKKNRPIASGSVSVATASAIGVVLLVAGLGLAFPLQAKAMWIVTVYLALQVLYNGWLKMVPIADVFLISSGFVLRAALGAAAINVQVSGWLLFCTGALALLIAFGKRRHEFVLQGEDRQASRESLQHYTRSALDSLVTMSACAAAICYGVYSLESGTAQKHPALIITAPFVFYGICRYVFLVFSVDEGGEPENLLFKDPHIVASLVLFVATALLAMSGLPMPLLDSASR